MRFGVGISQPAKWAGRVAVAGEKKNTGRAPAARAGQKNRCTGQAGGVPVLNRVTVPITAGGSIMRCGMAGGRKRPRNHRSALAVEIGAKGSPPARRCRHWPPPRCYAPASSSGKERSRPAQVECPGLQAAARRILVQLLIDLRAGRMARPLPCSSDLNLGSVGDLGAPRAISRASTLLAGRR